MFIELYKPRVIDIYQTRDRVKLRVGEQTQDGRFWTNLTFDNMDQLEIFATNIVEAIDAARACASVPK